MKQIHVVGTGPRTGTTLLAEAIRACCNIDFASAHEDRLFARPPAECDFYLSKHPGDLLVISPSLYVDPDLYVICMIRDPRDAVVSRHAQDPGRYWAGLRYWKAFYPLVQQFSQHRRFVTVRYEDFTRSPDVIQQRLISAIPGLSTIHGFSEYHRFATPSRASREALHSIRPIEPKGIGKWRQHLPRIKQQLGIHGDISEDLVECGYETSRDWLTDIERVESYVGDSHWPEHFTRDDLASRRRFRYREAAKRFFAARGVLSRLT